MKKSAKGTSADKCPLFRIELEDLGYALIFRDVKFIFAGWGVASIPTNTASPRVRTDNMVDRCGLCYSAPLHGNEVLKGGSIVPEISHDEKRTSLVTSR